MSFDNITEKKIKAWSYSRYTTYAQCPLKAKLKFIDKIQEPQNAAMERGSKIHDIAEQYLTLPGRRSVPDELMYFSELFRDLRKRARGKSIPMVVEEMWCFKRDWTPTHDKDWNNIWLRVKLDTAWFEDDTMIVNDWKTGKFRPDMTDSYAEQIELYAFAGLLNYEHVNIVKPRLSYLDYGTTYPDEELGCGLYYKRENIPDLKAKWEKKVEPMLNDTIFAPRPNDFCRWCYFSKKQCEY